MRVAGCPRICRAPILHTSHNPLHPKHQRLISSTSHHEQESSSHNTSAPYLVPPPKSENTPTAGPKGSPDYIPRKRGYAPNMPIPPRKFNLPTRKVKKPFPDPHKQAPEAKPRTIKTVKLEYELQLHAMRRGYVQWRVNDLKQKHEERLQKAARPRPPQKPAFQPTFAEAMASASQADQLVVEKQIFSTLHRPQHRKNRGEGYMTDRHQLLVAKQRRELINNYLALYHTAQDFITTPEQLEREVVRAFQDTGRGFEPFFPQTYQEILRDVEEGTAGGIFEGYTAKKYDEMGNDLYNAMMGTVAHGGPGYDEVMKEIEEVLAVEEETETTQEDPLQENLEEFVTEQDVQASLNEWDEKRKQLEDDSVEQNKKEEAQIQRVTYEARELRRNLRFLESLPPPPGPHEPMVLATDLDALNWQRTSFILDQNASSRILNIPLRMDPKVDPEKEKSNRERMTRLGDQQPYSLVDGPPPPPQPTAKELKALYAKFDSIGGDQEVTVDATADLGSAVFEQTSPVSENEVATLDDETSQIGVISPGFLVEELDDISSEIDQIALQSDVTEQHAETVVQQDAEQISMLDQTTEKVASQPTSKPPPTTTVNVKSATSPEEDQTLYRLREKYRSGFSNIHHKYGFMPFDPDESPDLQFPSDMQSFITQSIPASIVDQAEIYQKSKKPKSRSHRQILDLIRKQYEESRYASKFPELSSVDSSEEALQYLIEREEFEEAYPARKARQARNKEAWKKPVSGGARGNGGQTGVIAAGETEDDEVDRKYAELTGKKNVETQELGEQREGTSRDGVRRGSEFEGLLDEEQLAILAEIRARREARRVDDLRK